MSKLKSLASESSHYLIARVLAMATGFVSFPIYARVFSVADYGILNLGQRYSVVTVAVAKLGLQNAILRFHEDGNADGAGNARLYSTSLLGTAVSATLCSGLSAIFFLTAPETWVSPTVRWTLLASTGLVFVRAVSSPLFAFLRVEGRSISYSVADVCTRVLSVVFGLYMVLRIGRTPQNMLWGLVIAEGLVAVAMAAFFLRRHLIRLTAFDFSLLRQSLVFALPLAGSELAAMLLSSGDRAMVSYYLGAEPLGLYAAACAMATYLQEAIQVPLGLALVPLYVKTWNNEGPESTSQLLTQIFDFFLIASFLLAAVVFAAKDEMIVLVSSRKYYAAAPMLGPLVVGYLLFTSTVFLSAGFLLQKRTMDLAKLTVVAVTIKFALNWLLLPTLGLWGAVIPNVLGFGLLAGLYGWFSRTLLPIRISRKNLLVYTVSALAATLANFLDLGGLLLNLLAKVTVATAVYGAVLWLLDHRVRYRVSDAFQRLRRSPVSA